MTIRTIGTIFFFMASVALAAKSESRLTVEGFLVRNTKGVLYYVKNPMVLAPGLRVAFENEKAEQIACVLTSNKVPYECPRQTISFVPQKGFRDIQMAEARIENANTVWHRLKRKEEIFLPRSKQEKTNAN